MVQGKILVIDDEEFITKSLKQHLEKDGCEMCTAATGEEGLEIFKADAPDIVILDLNMPGIGGIETLKSLKKLSNDVIELS